MLCLYKSQESKYLDQKDAPSPPPRQSKSRAHQDCKRIFYQSNLGNTVIFDCQWLDATECLFFQLIAVLCGFLFWSELCSEYILLYYNIQMT